MRELKFRAWDAKAQHMFLNDYLNRIAERSGNQLSTQWPIQTLLHDESLIFMQYIGIHDRNGVEIYEGDLLRNYKLNPQDRVYNRIPIFEVSSCIDQLSGYKFQLIDVFRKNASASPQNTEVIGNIYQNPELLK